MKQIFITLFIFCVAFCYASDIIITKEEKAIKGKIIEIGIDVVKYIPDDNPSGPIYSILCSNIATIVYENGKVESYNETIGQSSINKVDNMYEHIFWDDEKNQFILHGDSIISTEQYLDYAQSNCYSAYKTYKNRYIRKYLGASFLGVGAATITITSIVEGVFHGQSIGGWAFFGIGTNFAIAGIPLLCTGTSPEEHSVDEYNANATKHKHISSLNLQCSQDGIGLALHF